MARLSRVLRSVEDGGLGFWCPGCDELHVIKTGQGEGPRWGYNGNPDAPTFTPSVLVRSGHYIRDKDGAESRPCWCDYNKEDGVEGKPPFECTICHSFVTDGKILFLGDCTHALKGQTVSLPDFPHADP